MTLIASISLGSAISGGTALGTVTGTAVAALASPYMGGLFDTDIIGAGMDFTYGSGGTAGTVWLQTSYNGGSSWMDVCAFNFAQATLSRYAAFNQGLFGTAAVVPTDATMAGSAIATFTPGNMLRTRYSNTGVYTASTAAIYLVAKR